jgi:mannitol-1-phosphate 5-dehydrogenase
VNKVFTGFGFGPIQSGLFVREVARSGNFKRTVVGEIDQTLVDAIRRNKGRYHVNIAEKDGIHEEAIEGVEIYNPSIPSDRRKLIESVSVSTEIATCLPSVSVYKSGGLASVAAILEAGLRIQSASGTIIYAAENNIRAAEILSSSIPVVVEKDAPKLQYLNTVIGKMSRIVTSPYEMESLGLAPITPGFPRAFLVEAFNHILVNSTNLAGFTLGIASFIEKQNLLPFEETKLFGHVAIHALLAYLGRYKGYKRMADVCKNTALMEIAQKAFIYESGAALRKKHASLPDPLFTEKGFSDYANDLLERMGNPFLGDTVERAGRDLIRKLGPEDRLFGTIVLAATYDIEAPNMALGAMAAMAALMEQGEDYKLPVQLRAKDLKDMDANSLLKLISWLWQDSRQLPSPELLQPLLKAKEKLLQL